MRIHSFILLIFALLLLLQGLAKLVRDILTAAGITEEGGII